MKKMKNADGTMEVTNMDDVIGTRRAAEILGVSVRTVQLWVENGTLKAWKTPGNHRRILKSSLDEVLAERTGSVKVELEPVRDVLVVEDEAAMQTYYEAMIELLRPDLPVRFVADGFDGLVEFGRQRPALMLLDIDMPGMDGIQMLSSLDRYGASEVTIVVVSGLSDEQIEARGGVPAGVPILSKPISVDALSGLLDQAFERLPDGTT